MGVRKKGLFISSGVIILIFLFQFLSSMAGNWAAGLFEYGKIDADNLFLYITVHHVVQMLPAIAVILLCSRLFSLDFGMKLRNVGLGFRYVAVFTGVIALYVLVSYVSGYALGAIGAYAFPLNTRNVLGTLGFQLLLSGPSEELLFRALPITILTCFCKQYKPVRIGKLHLPVEVIIAAVLFSAAHISWSMNPVSVSANAFQLAYALLLGLAYGVVYMKTNCILYPMLMHSISNVLMVGAGYLFATLLNP